MRSYVNKLKVWDFLLGGFATYGAIWAVLEPIGAFLPAWMPEGLGWFVGHVILSIIGGGWHARPASRIEFQIPGSDSCFEIKFGDVLKGEGVAVIPVNEYFDGELGDLVSEESLHGRFIRDILGGVAKSFFDLTAKELANVDPEDKKNVPRPSGQCVRYPIGTVARADVNEKRYLLAALSHTDVESLSAHATVQDLWTCLTGVWKAIREYSNGRPVRIPLIGSGLSKIGLPPANLIEVIATSFLCDTKQRKVTDKVTLVLPCRLAGKLDLKSIKRSWT